jgi:membrane-associated phospholipid phosphatase
MTVMRRGSAAATGLLVAACCAFGTFAVHRLFVGTALGQTVDQALLDKAALLPSVVDRLAHVLLSGFTLPLVVAACLVPPTLALLRRSPWLAAGALVLVAGANITTQVLKTYVFERPDLLALGAPNSLPSGHTTVAASVALALAVIAPPLLRVPTAVAGTAGSLLVGAATIVAGWHRLSDVVAAVMVSAAWAGLVVAFVVMRPRRPASADSSVLTVAVDRAEPSRRGDTVTVERTARRTRSTVHR